MRIAITCLSVWLGVCFAQTARGPRPIGTRGEVSASDDRLLTIQPYIELLGVYDSGMASAGLNSAGQVVAKDGYGGQITFGAAGFHRWQRTVLALDYDGNYHHNSANTALNGVNQSLTLGVTHALNPHTSFTLTESGGVYNRNFSASSMGGLSSLGGLGGLVVNPNAPFVPTGDIVDTRTYFSSTSGDLTVNKTARLSFNVGGTGFFVRRKAAGMASSNGGMARGDVGYQLTRRQTIGVQYAFMHVGFTDSFGGSDVHSVGFYHSVTPTLHTQVGYSVGSFRFQSTNTSVVALDPLIASLLGSGYSTQVSNRTTYGVAGSAYATYQGSRTTLNTTYRRSVVPGNGLYLTSRADSVSGSASYRALRRMSMGLDGNYNNYHALMQSLGNYQSYGGGASLATQVASHLHFTAHAGVRHYQLPGGRLERNAVYLQVGVGFTFREVPFPGL